MRVDATEDSDPDVLIALDGVDSYSKVTPEKVETGPRTIIEVSRPVRVILFGSYVRGEVRRNSDPDVLVVTDDRVENLRQERVRIRRALRDVLMPLDVLLVPRSRWEALKDHPGLIHREVLKSGRLVYESRQRHTSARHTGGVVSVCRERFAAGKACRH